jgi:hypothetical protein
MSARPHLRAGVLLLLAGCNWSHLSRNWRPPDGSAPVDGSCDGCIAGEMRNYMFVTSEDYDVVAGGIAGADGKCNQLAGAAGLPGSYVAWLSTKGASAISRLQTASGWIRQDRMPFAVSLEALRMNQILYPPRIDERGNDVGLLIDPAHANERYWVATGTLADLSLGPNASDWKDAAVEFQVGDVIGGSGVWTDAERTRSGLRRLYCFGKDHNNPLKAVAPIGRRAFLSGDFFAPASGTAMADKLCNDEAALAHLSGTYAALLATQGQSALGRMNLGSSAPWFRLDGVQLVSQASDFATTRMLAPLNLRYDGTYATDGAWTGADAPNQPPTTFNCSNWTSGSGSQVGTAGHSSSGDKDWFSDWTGPPCSQLGSVYCLEQ